MTYIQCMIVAAVLLGAFLGITTVVNHVRLYWRYLESISALTAWQEIFKIRACHLEDAEKSLYRYEFENDDSITEDIRQLIVQRIDLLGRSGVMQIVNNEGSERFVVCFVRQQLEELLNDSLKKAEKLKEEYEDSSSFAQDWMSEENAQLDKLYKEMLIKYDWVSTSSNRLISFFPKI